MIELTRRTELHRATPRGTTREVFLLGSLALKLPSTRSWRLFLIGLLCNLQEAEFARLGWGQLCPVVWSAPGGWLVVMRRARPLTDDEWQTLETEAFCLRPDGYRLPVEIRRDSFGVVDSRIVAVDYGS